MSVIGDRFKNEHRKMGRGHGEVEYEEEEAYASHGDNWERSRRGGRELGGGRRGAMRGRYDGGREDNNLGSIKMKIPSFHGKSDSKLIRVGEEGGICI